MTNRVIPKRRRSRGKNDRRVRIYDDVQLVKLLECETLLALRDKLAAMSIRGYESAGRLFVTSKDLPAELQEKAHERSPSDWIG